MHLAYVDDSDTKAKLRKWQVLSAVFIEDKSFKMVEASLTGISETLLPPEKLESFEEFHACELYGGYGVFDGIPQAERFEAIEKLLIMIGGLNVKIVYGAVDLEKLKKEVFASADPIDICFRICLKGIEKCYDFLLNEKIKDIAEGLPSEEEFRAVAFKHLIENLVILILDECDKKTKDTLTKTYRSIRPPYKPGKFEVNHLHDDMYFADSRFSVGIQLADVCSYFIAKHIEGCADSEGFYKMIEPHIVYGQSYPDMNEFPSQLSMLGQLLAQGESHERGLGEIQSSNESDNSGQSESGTDGDERGER